MTILQLRKLYKSADFYFFRNGYTATHTIHVTDKIKAYSVHTVKPNNINGLESPITYLNIEL